MYFQYKHLPVCKWPVHVCWFRGLWVQLWSCQEAILFTEQAWLRGWPVLHAHNFAYNIITFVFQSRNSKSGYIMSQLPMKNTITDFWRLIYDHGSNIILTLNALDEDQEVSNSFNRLKVSEYDQEIPQSQTADVPTTPWGRATGHLL